MTMAGGEQSERQVQRSILRMIDRCFPTAMYHHSANGAVLAGGTAQRARQMGCLKGDGLKLGFPDLIILWGRDVAFIEVKRPGGKPSDNQVAMLERLNGMGFRAEVIDNVDRAYVFLREAGCPWNTIDPRDPPVKDIWGTDNG